jgi:hypothetical protein
MYFLHYIFKHSSGGGGGGGETKTPTHGNGAEVVFAWRWEGKRMFPRSAEYYDTGSRRLVALCYSYIFLSKNQGVCMRAGKAGKVKKSATRPHPRLYSTSPGGGGPLVSPSEKWGDFGERFTIGWGREGVLPVAYLRTTESVALVSTFAGPILQL